MRYQYEILRVVISHLDKCQEQLNALGAQGYHAAFGEISPSGMLVVMERPVADGALELEAAIEEPAAEVAPVELAGEPVIAGYPFGKNIRVANGKPAKTTKGRGKFKPLE